MIIFTSDYLSLTDSCRNVGVRGVEGSRLDWQWFPRWKWVDGGSSCSTSNPNRNPCDSHRTYITYETYRPPVRISLPLTFRLIISGYNGKMLTF